MCCIILGRLKQRNWEFQASLGYRTWVCLIKNKTEQNKTPVPLFGDIFSIPFLYIKVKSSNNWRPCGDSTTYFDVINIDYLEGELSLDAKDLVPNIANVILYNLFSFSVS